MTLIKLTLPIITITRLTLFIKLNFSTSNSKYSMQLKLN